ncbi:FAD-dependent monooxygenase [Streptomyces sp. GQFP]|uniref:FAD-dependent monooxygenase n=1 Tax=Streptomyces sp. GQFP TaxID=2907545 RepID=UPI001F294032|nr:FAD-dependent monooxygenase [Streptomyces sp. GQFP]UIX31955.1 FAD-dependent monooxygenase [Streptomyces sp. GQFP]
MGPTWGRHSEEWVIHFTLRPDDPERFDKEATLPRLRALLKLPDLELTVHTVSHWILEGVPADRYRIGRVHLAGDAAHINSYVKAQREPGCSGWGRTGRGSRGTARR